MGAQTRIPIDIAGTWMNDIEYFKRELDDARDALIGIAPDQFHSQLHGFDCPMETWHDLHRWKAQTIEKIIKPARYVEAGALLANGRSRPASKCIWREHTRSHAQ